MNLLLLWPAAFLLTSIAQDIRLPPSIHDSPGMRSGYYAQGKQVNLVCDAVGDPAPNITWQRIGASMPGSGIVYIPPETRQILQLNASSVTEGDYQCFATNDYGATMSEKSEVRVASLEDYDPNAPATNYAVQTNNPVRLACNAPKSIPQAVITWSYSSSIGGPQTDITNSTWAQIDYDGDLCFANVSLTAGQGKVYRCNVNNPVLEVTKYGAYSNINVSGSASAVAPVLMFPASSSSTALGLVSQQTTLRCFFGGRDQSVPGTVTYTWTYNGANTLPIGWTFTDGNASSPLSGTNLTDAGTYVCTGTNNIGHNTCTIQLTVAEIPDFGSDPNANQPYDMNVTDGDTVEIKCQASATPAGTIKWYKNTVEFTPKTLPPKLSLSKDLTTLTITDVCKNCSDGTNDLMSIQCNVSNIHGYAFGQGYVNILTATEITSGPEDLLWEPHKIYDLVCEATCDDSTPCMWTWSLNGDEIQVNDTVSVDDSGTLHIDTSNDEDAGDSWVGSYDCNVTNGYSDAVITSTISRNVAAAELWWIGLLVALLILLLLILVVCCIFFCFCRDGKSYPVDENEKKNGNNPEKELRDTGFQDYMVTKNQPVHIYTNPVAAIGFDDPAGPPGYNGTVDRLTIDNASIRTYPLSDGVRIQDNTSRSGYMGRGAITPTDLHAGRYASEV